MLHWLPRILCMATILYGSIFALDAFQPGLTFWQQIAAFLIHMIPSFVLIAVLILAWKQELMGGSLFMLIGLGLTPWIYLHNYAMNGSVRTSLIPVLTLTMPFFVAGALFIWSYFAGHHIHGDG